MKEADFSFDKKSYNALLAAIRRSPGVTKSAVQQFLVRGLAAYRSVIYGNPWRMGMNGGGAPIAAINGGNLRRTHKQQISPWSARIWPTAKYAPYVHGIKNWPRKRTYQLRPWLDYAKDVADARVRRFQSDMINTIVGDLAK